MLTFDIRKTTMVLVGVALLLVRISAVATYARLELGIVHIAGVTYLQALRIDREVGRDGTDPRAAGRGSPGVCAPT